MSKKMIVASLLTIFPLLGLACSAGSVSKTVDRVKEAVAKGDSDEVLRTTSAVLAGAFAGAAALAPAAPATAGVAPVVGAVMGAACGCAVSNATAISP